MDLMMMTKQIDDEKRTAASFVVTKVLDNIKIWIVALRGVSLRNDDKVHFL